MTKLETDEEKLFEQKAFELGCKAIKFVIPSVRNAPDRMVLCPGGLTIFFEFKRGKAQPRKGQTNFHKGLRSLGFHCFVVYTASEALKILKETLDEF